MADYARYADSLRRLSVFFQDMVGAADLMDSIASNDGAIAGAVKAREKATADNQAAQDLLVKTNADYVRVKELVREAEIEAENVKGRTDRDAQAMIAKAKDEAKQVVEQAKKDGEAFAQKALDERADELAVVLGKIADANHRLIGLNADLSTAKGDLESVTAEHDRKKTALEALRSTAAALAGK